jgi:spore maturation protein B
MKCLLFFSDLIIPVLIFSIVLYGLLKKVPVFDVFTRGVEKGFRTVFQIAPTLIGLMVAVAALRGSGLLDFLISFFKPLGKLLHFPTELLPLIFIRLFSSSAATSFLLDIFKEMGPDSTTGRMASILLSCTEAAFYTMSVYYVSIHIKKTRWTLPGALFASFAGIIASILLTYFLF